VAEDMKNLPFGEAEPGATGLELLLSLALRWGRDSGLGLPQTLSRVTHDPVRVLGDALGSLATSAGRLVEGGVADVCLFDPAPSGRSRRRPWSARASTRPSALRHRHGHAGPRACHPGGRHRGLRGGCPANEALRACWRLLRVLLHGLHGLLLVLAASFRGCAPAQRQPRIGWWSAKMLRVLGMRLQVKASSARRHPGGGQPHLLAGHHGRARRVPRGPLRLQGRRAALAARQPPGGAAGTLYIEREKRRDALRVVHQMAQALQGGDTVAVFPEGTTGDGQALLPFHANLLQAAITTGTPVQPVALRLCRCPPRGEPGGAVGGRHHAGAKPVAPGVRQGLVVQAARVATAWAPPTPTGVRWPSTCAM
jgi:1-acyl-sn-glycerol-3-phosphate acyltransferase